MFRLLIEQFKFLIFIMETQVIYFYVETKNPVWNLMEFIFFFCCCCQIVNVQLLNKKQTWMQKHEKIIHMKEFFINSVNYFWESHAIVHIYCIR